MPGQTSRRLDREHMLAVSSLKVRVVSVGLGWDSKRDHSDRPTVALSEIERDVRIDRMKRVSCENTSGIWPRN